MAISVADSLNVVTRAKELGLETPGGISLMPRNFFDAASRDDLVHERDVLTLRKLLREQGVPETPFDTEPLPRLLERSASWVAPVIFVGGMLASQNPAAVSLALNIVTNYVTELFRGRIWDRRVRLEVIVETTPETSFKRISYEGSIDGVAELREAVEGLLHED